MGIGISFRDADKNTSTAPSDSKYSPIYCAYIVEHVEEVSMVEITSFEVTHLHFLYEKYAIICRFNGYWPFTLAFSNGSTHLGQINVIYLSIPKIILLFSSMIMLIINRCLRRVCGFGVV
jgi:hypothetical protein